MSFAKLLVLIGTCCASVSAAIVNGGTLGVPNAAVLTVNVDNYYSVYWNGEYLGNGNTIGWTQTTQYTLIPVNKCNYQNILAINATGDRAVDDGLIMQVKYGGSLWKSGASPAIKVGLPSSVNDPQWYMNPYSNPSVWANSNIEPLCSMVASQMNIQSMYYTAGTRWIWYGSCTALRISQVYFKLVIPTICNCCCDTPTKSVIDSVSLPADRMD